MEEARPLAEIGAEYWLGGTSDAVVMLYSARNTGARANANNAQIAHRAVSRSDYVSGLEPVTEYEGTGT